MKVLISGATGLVGTALSQALRDRGDAPVTLTRSPDRAEGPAVGWDPNRSELDLGDVEGFDAVVHLAGESIASGRWTAEQKRRIQESRTKGTALLADALARADAPPSVFVSASAIGFYGDRGDEPLEETADPGKTFLAEVCMAWEAAAEAARQAGVRVVHPRIGVVLAADGGALPKMLLPFKLGMGGRIGSGDQYMPWVGLDDVVGLILHAIDHAEVRGPMNVTAPEPVTNAAFTRALGKVLGRPTFVPLPAFAAKLALGEMADELLLSSARVLPRVALDTGYRFRFSDVETCLRATLGG